MAVRKPHRILIASDGSRAAQAALETAVKLPWPASSRLLGVVARSGWMPFASDDTRAAVEASFEEVGAAARSALARSWPQSSVVVVDAPPVEAILAEAQRFDASVIVLGWRGHGVFRRLLAGSVSRSVAARARCPVLVVREAPRAVRRFVLGFDGCPNAEHALDFLGSLEPGRGRRVVLVNVVEAVIVPASVRQLPASMRAQIRGEVAAQNQERLRQAQATVEAGAARLERCGWKAQCDVRVGAPHATLLKAVAVPRGDLLVLGARATSGVERALLGSVANGALNSSRAVLLVP
ncbi:universal stress protein [Methylibium sp.]|uniref:universal stress protein n=1 Tax=Methylibium sp. TaxID=2067992 RepID=UPI00286A0BDC|nr:universal stress protein [Methylibium sp.]